jgi:hypothetical protein
MRFSGFLRGWDLFPSLIINQAQEMSIAKTQMDWNEVLFLDPPKKQRGKLHRLPRPILSAVTELQ